nr:MAG TPA: hypothetical protein [Caudoviricetes sp.]
MCQTTRFLFYLFTYMTDFLRFLFFTARRTVN